MCFLAVSALLVGGAEMLAPPIPPPPDLEFGVDTRLETREDRLWPSRLFNAVTNIKLDLVSMSLLIN